MKLSSREARAFLRAPRDGIAAALIAGEDAARVALARGDLVAAWAGPGAEAEMRVERLAAADLRRDGALLVDALKARGFFPGPRVVVLDDATDGLASAVGAALAAWAEGDARLVAAGAGLSAKGALRRLFEADRRAVAIALYDDPPDPSEVEAMLREAGLSPDPEAREAIHEAARSLPPGEFRGLVEKLSLHQSGHQSGDAPPLTAATVAALAPATGEAGVDDLLLALSEGRKEKVPGLLARLAAQGVAPVAVAIALGRHWRAAMLVQAAGGGEAGLAALRPPAGGLRRQAIQRAAAWRRERLEEALRLTVELDLGLRGGSAAPGPALLERTLLRQAALRGG